MMLVDEAACVSEARYSRLVLDANLSSTPSYGVASPLGMLIAGAIVSGRGARATPEDFIDRCMAGKGYAGIARTPSEAKTFGAASTAQAKVLVVEQFYAAPDFEARRQAASAADAAKLAPVGVLASSWVVGDVSEGYDSPLHLELGPSQSEIITSSRMVPTALTMLDQIATPSGGKTPVLSPGIQLFQLSDQKHPTFCTLVPRAKFNYVCLIDLDEDAKLETAVLARSLTPALPLLELDSGTAIELISPVTVHKIASEDCTCQIRAYLIYAGRRSMSRRDAGFELSINSNGASVHSPMFSLYLDDLPESFEVLGARFENISRMEKVLRFDLPVGFEKGRPYVPYFGGTYVEWGF